MVNHGPSETRALSESTVLGVLLESVLGPTTSGELQRSNLFGRVEAGCCARRRTTVTMEVMRGSRPKRVRPAPACTLRREQAFEQPAALGPIGASEVGMAGFGDDDVHVGGGGGGGAAQLFDKW